eukprot:scpid107667/ scgid16343/ 
MESSQMPTYMCMHMQFIHGELVDACSPVGFQAAGTIFECSYAPFVVTATSTLCISVLNRLEENNHMRFLFLGICRAHCAPLATVSTLFCIMQSKPFTSTSVLMSCPSILLPL